MPINMNIQTATIGGSRIAVVNNGKRPNTASTLLVSYADPVKVIDTTLHYAQQIHLGGIPLVTHLFSDIERNPSLRDEMTGYNAIDVIENNASEDVGYDPSREGNIPYDPSDRTFTWNGNRLSASRKDNRYYCNVVVASQIATAIKPITFMGVPMALGPQNELILNVRSNTTMDDVQELVTVTIGGTPLTAGRIGNSYYLIVSPIAAEDA